MASTFPLLAVAAIAAAPHLGVAGDAGPAARVAVAVLRDRARRYGARLRTKASSAS
jgi:hypothetical protein